jgi:hypothetical protein
MKFSFLSLFCFFSWFMLNSTIIYVDGNNTQGPWDGSLGYPWQFIQDGIDNASDNDIVSVEDGVYDENLYIQNLSISVKSQSENPELCTINGSSQKVIELYHTSDTDKVLSIIGFTIIGSMEYKGIYASKYQYSNGSFTVNIRKNIFQDFLFCMDIHELDYCEISDNSLTNSSQIINSYGIVIIELDEISIYNNYISNFKYGICFLLSNADVYNNEIEVYYNEGVGKNYIQIQKLIS